MCDASSSHKNHFPEFAPRFGPDWVDLRKHNRNRDERTHWNRSEQAASDAGTIDGGAVEPHGFSPLCRSSIGYEGRATVVPLVSSAKLAEASA